MRQHALSFSSFLAGCSSDSAEQGESAHGLTAEECGVQSGAILNADDGTSVALFSVDYVGSDLAVTITQPIAPVVATYLYAGSPTQLGDPNQFPYIDTTPTVVNNAVTITVPLSQLHVDPSTNTCPTLMVSLFVEFDASCRFCPPSTPFFGWADGPITYQYWVQLTPKTGYALESACCCSPTTCAAAGAECGTIDDTCGGTALCGTCADPLTCGAGGAGNACGCTPTTCAAAGVTCGTVADGCGTTLVCGACAEPSLAAIGNQTVALGSTLNLQLSATDPDGDPLAFSADPLPLATGASLDGGTGAFTFKPSLEHVGTSQLTFRVSDGASTDEETISITVTTPGPGQPTTVSGQLLDTNDFVLGTTTPIVGATISFLNSGVSTTTDAVGAFQLSGAPGGDQVLDIDSSTALPAANGATYAGFREAFFVIDNVDNIVDRPFFMPQIDPTSVTLVDPDATTVVTNPILEISIVVPPHTAKNADGTDFTGSLSISEVPEALAPAAMPPEFSPVPLITIQPVGVFFATPVAISFPNIDQFAAGSEVDIYSIDPTIGEFIVVGIGLVSANGLRIDTHRWRRARCGLAPHSAARGRREAKV